MAIRYRIQIKKIDDAPLPGLEHLVEETVVETEADKFELIAHAVGENENTWAYWTKSLSQPETIGLCEWLKNLMVSEMAGNTTEMLEDERDD